MVFVISSVAMGLISSWRAVVNLQRDQFLAEPLSRFFRQNSSFPHSLFERYFANIFSGCLPCPYPDNICCLGDHTRMGCAGCRFHKGIQLPPELGVC